MAHLSNKQFWESAKLNNRTYINYYNRLMELSLSMFEWSGLPDTVDARFLELALFGNGMAVFFNDEDIGYLALRTTIGGPMNVYQIPTRRRAFASNGYQRDLDENNSVIIFNNLIHTNAMSAIELYALRLYEIERTVDTNVKAQKTPILISCDETQRLTLLNLYKNYDGNIPFIFGDKNITPNALKAINTGAPYLADKLHELKLEIWNEALTYLGISNINVVKKERLITDEATRNMGGILASRFSRLEARRQACDQINKMFGLNVWVDYRQDVIPEEYETMAEFIQRDTAEDNGGNEVE